MFGLLGCSLRQGSNTCMRSALLCYPLVLNVTQRLAAQAGLTLSVCAALAVVGGEISPKSSSVHAVATARGPGSNHPDTFVVTYLLDAGGRKNHQRLPTSSPKKTTGLVLSPSAWHGTCDILPNRCYSMLCARESDRMPRLRVVYSPAYRRRAATFISWRRQPRLAESA